MLIDFDREFAAVLSAPPRTGGGDPRGGGNTYIPRRIDRTAGCIVIVRPDQHLANVLPLDAVADLAEFFDGFMVAPGRPTGTPRGSTQSARPPHAQTESGQPLNRTHAPCQRALVTCDPPENSLDRIANANSSLSCINQFYSMLACVSSCGAGRPKAHVLRTAHRR